MNELRTDIYGYCGQKRAKWIVGEGDIDADWAEYLENLEEMGVDELIEILQSAYDVWAEAYNKVS